MSAPLAPLGPIAARRPAPVLSRGKPKAGNGIRAWSGAILLALAVTGLAPGCRPSPYADRRLQMRLDNMRETLDAAGRSEASRPAKLEAAGQYIDMSLRRSARRLVDNAREAERMVQRDVQRFGDLQPVYLRETLRLLWGRPERIEENFITLFF